MRTYLEYYYKDIKAFKKAIKLCKGHPDVIKVLNDYKQNIEREFGYADFLKKSFMPLINKKKNFYRGFIFEVNGDFRVDVFINNADEASKTEYYNIFNEFCKKDEETFFYFNVYDVKKDKQELLEAKDYDRMTIYPKK